MNRNKREPDIIEVKESATEDQINLLQKMNPNSLILKECDVKLKEIYKKINDGD